MSIMDPRHGVDSDFDLGPWRISSWLVYRCLACNSYCHAGTYLVEYRGQPARVVEYRKCPTCDSRVIRSNTRFNVNLCDAGGYIDTYTYMTGAGRIGYRLVAGLAQLKDRHDYD